MPVIRAREFYKRNLKTPLDILKANEQQVIQVIIDTLPFNTCTATTTTIDNMIDLNQRNKLRDQSIRQLMIRIYKACEEDLKNERNIQRSIQYVQQLTLTK